MEPKDAEALRQKLRDMNGAHALMRGIDLLYRQAKAARNRKPPDMERVRLLERRMTEIAQQYMNVVIPTRRKTRGVKPGSKGTKVS